MSQPTTGGGQRTVSQPMFFPTLMPMHSLPQVVMTSGSVVVSAGNGMTSVITGVGAPVLTTAAFSSQTHPMSVGLSGAAMEQETRKADLYLCSTSNNATGNIYTDTMCY